jgi:capsule polysaccharide export protein KpsE/RkpR
MFGILMEFTSLYPNFEIETYYEIWQEMLQVILDSQEVIGDIRVWAKTNGLE